MKTVSLVPIVLAATALPVAAHAQAFDGPSIGMQAGWVQNSVRNPTTDLGVTSIDARKNSAVFGGYIGYDKSFGHVVVGTEAGLSFETDSRIDSGTGLSIKPKRAIELTARVGYLVTPQTLVYVRGGYDNDRLGTTIPTVMGAAYASQNRGAGLAGAGIERALMPHVSARLEYRYTDLSNGDGKFDRHQVFGGVTYRF